MGLSLTIRSNIRCHIWNHIECGTNLPWLSDGILYIYKYNRRTRPDYTLWNSSQLYLNQKSFFSRCFRWRTYLYIHTCNIFCYNNHIYKCTIWTINSMFINTRQWCWLKKECKNHLYIFINSLKWYLSIPLSTTFKEINRK